MNELRAKITAKKITTTIEVVGNDTVLFLDTKESGLTVKTGVSPEREIKLSIQHNDSPLAYEGTFENLLRLLEIARAAIGSKSYLRLDIQPTDDEQVLADIAAMQHFLTQ